MTLASNIDKEKRFRGLPAVEAAAEVAALHLITMVAAVSVSLIEHIWGIGNVAIVRRRANGRFGSKAATPRMSAMGGKRTSAGFHKSGL